jgi:nucleoside 2-deoxyribosyltransferase
MMTKKIYFAGSIRGGRDDRDLYRQLINHLAQYGDVVTEHVGNDRLAELGEDDLSDELIYYRDMSWIQESDVLIAEVSTPSLGVGYEIGKAEDMKKNMLCLYRNQHNRRLSAMINGNPNVTVVRYDTVEDAFHHIDMFFASLE